jgi:hypothetical protein
MCTRTGGGTASRTSGNALGETPGTSCCYSAGRPGDMPRHYGASAAAERAMETQQRIGIDERV